MRFAALVSLASWSDSSNADEIEPTPNSPTRTQAHTGSIHALRFHHEADDSSPSLVGIGGIGVGGGKAACARCSVHWAPSQYRSEVGSYGSLCQPGGGSGVELIQSTLVPVEKP